MLIFREHKAKITRDTQLKIQEEVAQEKQLRRQTQKKKKQKDKEQIERSAEKEKEARQVEHKTENEKEKEQTHDLETKNNDLIISMPTANLLHVNLGSLLESVVPNSTREVILRDQPASAQRTQDSEDNGLVIFCVDTSYSMTAEVDTEGKTVCLPRAIHRQCKNHLSRIGCIKSAIQCQLEIMQRRFPKQRPVVIAFSDTLTIFSGGQEPI